MKLIIIIIIEIHTIERLTLQKWYFKHFTSPH